MPADASSPQWIEAARAIRQGAPEEATPRVVLRMNLVVEDVPETPEPLDAYLDTTTGFFDVELGHLDAPDVTVRLGYATARAIFVDGDAQAGMQAFMAGKVRVEGDMTKLLALQAAPSSPGQQAVAARIRAITT